MGSSLSLTTGESFDVKVRPTVVERTRVNTSPRWKTRMLYAVSNASPSPVVVEVVQQGLWGDTRITDETMKSDRLNADEARWRVPVPANGRASISATFDTRF
jgi:hypothetical protein